MDGQKYPLKGGRTMHSAVNHQQQSLFTSIWTPNSNDIEKSNCSLQNLCKRRCKNCFTDTQGQGNFSRDILKEAMELTDSPLHLAVTNKQLAVCEALLIEQGSDDREYFKAVWKTTTQTSSRDTEITTLLINML